MHTITLNIDNSIYSKFKALLDLFPKDKISVEEDNNFPDELVLSEGEAKEKVQRAVNNITEFSGLDIDEAFEKVLSK